MKGIIRMVSGHNGYIAAETESGCYSIFEILGFDLVETGDVIIGDLSQPGRELVRNESKFQDLCIEVHQCECSQSEAKQLL